MDKQINLSGFVAALKKNSIAMAAIPMGYSAGLPILSIKKKKVCITVPFFKFAQVNEVDKSLIFPIRYTLTALWATGKIIELRDLAYHPRFENVDFSKPIGLFRHQSIQEFNAGQYRQKREELYSMYDKLIAFLQDDAEYTQQDESEFTTLLNIILEPSLVPIYRALGDEFATKFITEKSAE